MKTTKISNFGSTKLFATFFAMVILVAGATIKRLDNTDAYLPFILALLAIYIIFIAVQGVLDFSQVSVDTKIFSVQADPSALPSIATIDNKFFSKKMWMSVLMMLIFTGLYYIGNLNAFTFVSCVTTVYAVWTLIEGSVNIKKIMLDTQFLKILPDIVPQVIAGNLPVSALAPSPSPDPSVVGGSGTSQIPDQGAPVQERRIKEK